MPDRRHDGEADRSWIELLRCSRTSDPTAIFAARMLGNLLRLGSRRAWEMHANLPGKLGDETVIDLGLPSATAVTLAFAPFGVFKALGLGPFGWPPARPTHPVVHSVFASCSTRPPQREDANVLTPDA